MAAEALAGHDPALRPADLRRAPGRRAAARAGHHHALRPRQAAGRRARLRRRGRHPLRRAPTASTTAPSTASSCGARASCGPSQAWASEHGVDLAESWAYSDSFYDLPDARRRRHPVAVNPDPRMLGGGAAAPLAGACTSTCPPACRSSRCWASSRSRRCCRSPVPSSSRSPASTSPASSTSPPTGPAIVVGNHRSYFDPLAMAVVLAKRGRPVRFLGKKEVFDAPVVGQLARAMGGIRVERGTGLRRAAGRGGRRRSRPARSWR